MLCLSHASPFLEWSNQKSEGISLHQSRWPYCLADLPRHKSHRLTIYPVRHAPLPHRLCEVLWSSISFPTTRLIPRSYPPRGISAIGSVLADPYRHSGRPALSSSDHRFVTRTNTRLSGKLPGAGSEDAL